MGSNADGLSIDDDILNLIDEVDLEEVLKEAADAIEDADRLTDFIREKSTVAIERFLVGSFASMHSRLLPRVFLTTSKFV